VGKTAEIPASTTERGGEQKRLGGVVEGGNLVSSPVEVLGTRRTARDSGANHMSTKQRKKK